MTRILLAATLSLAALPALAGGVGISLPHLSFPGDKHQTTTVTTSHANGK